jgi:hypothetical protein
MAYFYKREYDYATSGTYTYRQGVGSPWTGHSIAPATPAALYRALSVGTNGADNTGATKSNAHDNIRIVSRQNDANYYDTHLSVYQNVSKTLRYVHRRTINITTPTWDQEDRIAIDGGGAASAVVNNNISGTIKASSDAGQWSAIDYDSSGFPVIAYYDRENRTVRLAYASAIRPNGSNGSNWTRRFVMAKSDPDSYPYYDLSGTYISMKIDRRAGANLNTIHLAFCNSSNSTVVYAYGKKDGTFTTERVDTAVQGGTWTDIALDSNGNPWITYTDSDWSGADGAVKIAYRNGSNDFFYNEENKWETLSVPTTYVVNDDRLSIEAWPPANDAGTPNPDTSPAWSAAVAYPSDKFRISYFLKPVPAVP